MRQQSYLAAADIVQSDASRRSTLRRFPVRQADFFVLQAPDMPSMLIELGLPEQRGGHREPREPGVARPGGGGHRQGRRGLLCRAAGRPIVTLRQRARSGGISKAGDRASLSILPPFSAMIPQLIRRGLRADGDSLVRSSMFRLLGWLFGFGVFCALAGVAVGVVYLNQVSAEPAGLHRAQGLPAAGDDARPRGGRHAAGRIRA